MPYTDPSKDGVRLNCLIDFNLLERQLENKGEYGFVSVDVVLSLLRRIITPSTEEIEK